MALNIKDPETDRLARELSALTGENITTALRGAVEQRLARERAKRSAPSTRTALRELIRHGRERPTLDNRDADAILGYDSAGIPT